MLSLFVCPVAHLQRQRGALRLADLVYEPDHLEAQAVTVGGAAQLHDDGQQACSSRERHEAPRGRMTIAVLVYATVIAGLARTGHTEAQGTKAWHA